MAQQVIRYLLEGDGSIPLFVKNGGYFMLGAELVGVSVDENERHVPLSVVRMTKADLLLRVQACCKDSNGNYVNDADGVPLSDARASDMCDAWLAAVGMSDLA